MATIQIELERSDEARAELEALDASVVAEPENFDGGTSIISAVVVLSPIVIPGIVAIVKARIGANRYVKVKMKGIEVTGASLKDIEKFLKSQQNES